MSNKVFIRIPYTFSTVPTSPLEKYEAVMWYFVPLTSNLKDLMVC